MRQYLDLLSKVINQGEKKSSRTVDTYSLFGEQIKFNLQEGFPAVTTKPLYWKGVVKELLWFLRGDTNIKFLVDRGVNIWNQDAYNFYRRNYPFLSCSYFVFNDIVSNKLKSDYKEEIKPDIGDCGNIYGYQWRKFNGETDQIAELIRGLVNNPFGRRHIISSWNPEDIKEDLLALPPCHVLAQFNVSSDGKYLDCQLYQRSADIILGVPFNIASYALLTHIIAQICGYEVRNFVHTFGDVHIYENHLEAGKEQLEREPYRLPELHLTFFYDLVKEIRGCAENDSKILSNLIDEYIDALDVDMENVRLLYYIHHPKLNNSTPLNT